MRGSLFWGPYNGDPTIWGTILGSPLFGNSHMPAWLATIAFIHSGFLVAVRSSSSAFDGPRFQG